MGTARNDMADAGRASANARDTKTGPLKSPKQLREAASAPARALSEEQLRALRDRTQQAERRTGRIMSQVVLLLFALLLLFAVPLLIDPTRTRAEALLGAKLQLGVAAFAVLSVVALVQTWALQIQSRPMMLRPVTITLKAVTATICLLASAFFLPEGSLGPAERVARNVLPWAAALYYLFLALYGIVHGIRHSSTSLLAGLGMALLYSGGFAGSCRVLATSVLVKQAEEEDSRLKKLAEMKRKHGRSDAQTLAEAANGKLRPGENAESEELRERKEAGGSEEEDLRMIEDMNRARQRKTSEFDGLGKQIDGLMK
jgi:hypothetical protein